MEQSYENNCSLYFQTGHFKNSGRSFSYTILSSFHFATVIYNDRSLILLKKIIRTKIRIDCFCDLQTQKLYKDTLPGHTFFFLFWMIISRCENLFFFLWGKNSFPNGKFLLSIQILPYKITYATRSLIRISLFYNPSNVNTYHIIY